MKKRTILGLVSIIVTLGLMLAGCAEPEVFDCEDAVADNAIYGNISIVYRVPVKAPEAPRDVIVIVDRTAR